MPATWELDGHTDIDRGLARQVPSAPRAFIMNRAERRRLAKQAGHRKFKRRKK